MFRPRTTWLGHVISFLLLVPASVFSQTDRGQPSVSGCVQDPSQAAIRGAAVSLAGQSESLRRQAQTNDKGCFALYDISDGMYNLRILAEGFSPHEQVIRVGKDPVKIDSVTLEL